MEIKSGIEMEIGAFIDGLRKQADTPEFMRSGMGFKEVEEGVKITKHQLHTGVDRSYVMPSIDTLKTFTKEAGVEWKDGSEDRILATWASDERVDRHGDIVRQNWDLANYKNNPVLQFSHEWNRPPVGNSIKQEVVQRTDKRASFEGPALRMLNLFMDNEQDPSGFSNQIFCMINSGFLRACSVGFFPKKITFVEDKDERQELGLGPFGVVFDESELAELSPTAIPANAGAVSILNDMKAAGQLHQNSINIILESTRNSIVRGKGDSQQWFKQQDRWLSVWRALFPQFEIDEHKNLDEPVEYRDIKESEGAPAPNADLSVQIDELKSFMTDKLDSVKSEISSLGDKVEEIREAVDDVALQKEISKIVGNDEETHNSLDAIVNSASAESLAILTKNTK